MKPLTKPLPDTGKPFSKEFQNLEKIGEGGMGLVYKATQHLGETPRTVAIKFLDSQHKGHDLACFDKEAEIMARLKHPNIIQIYAAGKDDTLRPYIVMEYFGGKTLDLLIKEKGRFSQQEALQIGIHIAEAIRHAHEKRIIHRDLHPENIMIVQETQAVKIADLGVATVMDQKPFRGTRIIGIPRYLSPEQAQGKKIDGRADLYSIGMILYEMVTGHCYFAKEMHDSEILSHLFNKKEFHLCYPDDVVHPLFQKLIRDLVKKNPNDRIPNAEILLTRMRQALNALKDLQEGKSLLPYLTGIGLIILLIGGIGFSFYSNPEQTAISNEVPLSPFVPQPTANTSTPSPLPLIEPIKEPDFLEAVQRPIAPKNVVNQTQNKVEEPLPQASQDVQQRNGQDTENAMEDIRKQFSQLKADYESLNLGALQKNTILSEKKAQFLRKLFGHYETITLSISDPLFMEQNQSVVAMLTIVRLVDQSGNEVIPAEKWKETPLEIRKVNDQWKIFW
jgi:serine/threonine protein kinase